MSTETHPTVTPAATWKSKAAKGGELQVPSGNVCLVRKPDGMRVFMAKGMIPNSLMPIIQSAIDAGTRGEAKPVDPGEMMTKVMEDPNMLADMIELVDAVVCDIVLEPKVHPNEERDAIYADENLSDEQKQERVDGMLFVDEVDLDDRMFIFNYAVGGTKDLERFRAEQAASLASISDVGEVRNKAE